MDMRDLLKQLDSIGSEITDEAVEEKKSSDEMVEEVVGPKEPIYDLLDQLGDNAEAKLLHDLIRYLDAAVIKDFVDEFRSNYDYGKGIEYESSNNAEVKRFVDDQVQEDCACEDTVEETVEVAVNDLRSLLDLAGLSPQETTQATTELEEYANSPDEDYQDTDVQLNKMSGGLNGPKGQHKKEYPGDNPLAAELAEKLKAMLEK
jgi:hypothetical protein